MPAAWYVIVGLCLLAALVRNLGVLYAWARRRSARSERIVFVAPPSLPAPANDDALEEVHLGIFRGPKPN